MNQVNAVNAVVGQVNSLIEELDLKFQLINAIERESTGLLSALMILLVKKGVLTNEEILEQQKEVLTAVDKMSERYVASLKPGSN
jgi:hypothetical protein